MFKHPSDIEVEKAIDHFKKVLDGAENCNYSAENALWKAYLALYPDEAHLTLSPNKL